jgi:4,5-DOPA dioxygenase extradiol
MMCFLFLKNSYYGFPKHFYDVKYPWTGDKELAEKVVDTLKDSGLDAVGVERGLDHGVFAPFLCSEFSTELLSGFTLDLYMTNGEKVFPPEKNPLGVPIVQVSLFSDDDGPETAEKHFELGKALQGLRDEGVLIMCSGMAVHNLGDMRNREEMPYVKEFDDELEKAVMGVDSSSERKENLRKLLEHRTTRQAHPTFEHLLPVHIAAGAAGDDKAKKTFHLIHRSFSWAQYRFGNSEEN